MNLQSCINEWQAIGAPQVVLDWLSDGVQLPFDSVPDSVYLSNQPCTRVQKEFIDNEIQDLLHQGIVEQCPPNHKPHVVSPIKVVPKSGDKKWRLITDLRVLNTFITPPKFTNEGIKDFEPLVKPNDMLITVDLKNGFFHVPIAKNYRTFLGFSWNNQFYQWARCPFGLNISPFCFTKILRPVVTFLRLQGLRICLYVDDWILTACPQTIIAQKNVLLNTLIRLGWMINYKKSSLVPETTKKWIGYVVSSSLSQGQPGILIPATRIRKLKKDIKRVLHQGQATARMIARIAGQCVAMAEVILPAKLLLRDVYRVLNQKRSWQDTVKLTQGAARDLIWWLQALDGWNGKPIKPQKIDVQITTDASATGWGAWMMDQKAAGFWDKSVSVQSSNHRELLAVYMALQAFRDNVVKKSVQIVSDNVTTIAYLNHLGGPTPALTQLAKSIWAFVYRNNMELSARYLAGKENVLADSLSRLNPKYEWQLHPLLFKCIDSRWGPHTIDRFATMSNTQINRYNSRFADPFSQGVDALAQTDWMHENNYCAPPFRLIARVLDTVQAQKATATILAPYWPAQPWFQRLRQMSIAPPLELTTGKRTIWTMHPSPEPLRNRRWKLLAWRICGNLDYVN